MVSTESAVSAELFLSRLGESESSRLATGALGSSVDGVLGTDDDGRLDLTELPLEGVSVF